MLTRSGGGPSPALLVVAALTAVVGGLVLWLGLSGPREIPPEALTPLTAGSVAVEEGGLSLWSADEGAWETTVCTAGGTTLLRPVSHYSIEVAGREVHEVARTPRGLPAGSYAVACTPEQELSTGPHAEATAVSALRGPVGVALGAALLGVALLLALVALVARRRQARLEAWRVPAHRLDLGARGGTRDIGGAEPPGAAEGAQGAEPLSRRELRDEERRDGRDRRGRRRGRPSERS